MANSRAVVLFIVHSWGGGTIRFAQELAQSISDRVDVVWAWGVENKTIHISTRALYDAELSFDLANGLDAPLSALQALGPGRVNVIQTIGLQEHINALIERLAVPYDVTFTDYHYFSARPHFEDDSGRYIGDAAVAEMARAARGNVPALLRNAERCIAISRDLAHRLEMFMPGLPVIPVRVSEPAERTGTPVRVVPLAENEPMRVLVLGRLFPHKGLATVAEVARRAERENFPVEIASLGETYPHVTEVLKPLQRVRILGGYEQEALATIVSGLNPHLVWLPFTLPETHSYALSDAMSFGLPVLTAGIGAVSERVAGRRSTWVVPFEEATADRYFDWLTRLRADRMQTPSQCPPVDHLPPAQRAFYPDGYLRPVLGAGMLGRLFGALSPLRQLYGRAGLARADLPTAARSAGGGRNPCTRP